MIELFGLAELEVTRAQISDWLKKDNDPDNQAISDEQLATFLNGFISDKRGKKDGPQPDPEKLLNNNIILRKLKIALQLRDDDLVDIIQLVGFTVSKHEINAIFRNPKQKQYRPCKDQFLRYFLKGLQLKYRGDEENN
jgi:uncharacterized protein YehS (DUF1456 family)